MKTNLYIPEKIVVGFQKRTDTFTGKLGFVTYRDDKGVLRQEKSWNGWRDHKIEVQEFDNAPRSNFVFNKDIKRSGHWSTHSKVRIYDSRDFEFEIELSNMMYILMHSDVSKRDIQEECVLAWDGKNLVLLPVNSEEYRNSVAHTKKQAIKFSLKDLVKGHTYSTKKANMGEFVYLGYFEWCEKDYSSVSRNYVYKNTGKKHVFYSEKKYYGERFHVLTGNDIAECVSNEIHPQYSNYVESLTKSPHMQKIGIFSVKKGFDKVGYKKASYENLEVTLINSPKADFNIKEVSFETHQDTPSVRRSNNRNSYSYYGDGTSYKKRQYLKHMKEKNIDSNNYEALKQFFESIGFGTLQYTNTEGKKAEVK